MLNNSRLKGQIHIYVKVKYKDQNCKLVKIKGLIGKVNELYNHFLLQTFLSCKHSFCFMLLKTTYTTTI